MHRRQRCEEWQQDNHPYGRPRRQAMQETNRKIGLRREAAPSGVETGGGVERSRDERGGVRRQAMQKTTKKEGFGKR